MCNITSHERNMTLNCNKVTRYTHTQMSEVEKTRPGNIATATHAWLGGTWKDKTFGRLFFFFNLNTQVPYDSAIQLTYWPGKTENMYAQKHLYRDVHSNFSLQSKTGSNQKVYQEECGWIEKQHTEKKKTHKSILYMFPFLWDSRKDKSYIKWQKA